jgi:hypothetical protein
MPAPDVFFALPFSRLPGNRGKTGQFCRLLTAQFSKLGHVRERRTGCDFGDAGNARQNVSFGAQLFICSNDRVDQVCNSGKSAIRERSRSICRVSKRWFVAAGRALAAVQSLISACRAVANCLRTLRVSRVTASAFRCNSDPVLARIAASTRSVFAR